MSKYKAIIFDLDGTLVDTDLLIIQTYLYMFKKYRPDYKPSLHELVSFLGPALETTFPKYFKENVQDLIKDYCEFNHNHMKEYVTIYPYVEETLIALKNKGVKLGIVTLKFLRSAKKTLECFDLEKYFDSIIALEDVSKPKPDPQGILKSIEKLGCKKSEVLFMGDNESDFLAAKNAGIDFAIVNWSTTNAQNKVKADYFISSYKQLLEVINDD